MNLYLVLRKVQINIFFCHKCKQIKTKTFIEKIKIQFCPNEVVGVQYMFLYSDTAILNSEQKFYKIEKFELNEDKSKNR